MFNEQELIKSILLGQLSLDDLTPEAREIIAPALALVKYKIDHGNETLEKSQLNQLVELAKADFISPDQQKKNKEKAKEKANKDAFRQAKIQVPQKDEDDKPKLKIEDGKIKTDEPKKNHLTVVKAEECQEVCKFDSNGQWSIEKAITSGPTLDYAATNKPKKQDESNTQTIDYSSGTPKIKGPQWSSKDTVGGVPKFEDRSRKNLATSRPIRNKI
jgi:hypothetical protein